MGTRFYYAIKDPLDFSLMDEKTLYVFVKEHPQVLGQTTLLDNFGQEWTQLLEEDLVHFTHKGVLVATIYGTTISKATIPTHPTCMPSAHKVLIVETLHEPMIKARADLNKFKLPMAPLYSTPMAPRPTINANACNRWLCG